jgi:hypothetical protein
LQSTAALRLLDAGAGVGAGAGAGAYSSFSKPRELSSCSPHPHEGTRGRSLARARSVPRATDFFAKAPRKAFERAANARKRREEKASAHAQRLRRQQSLAIDKRKATHKKLQLMGDAAFLDAELSSLSRDSADEPLRFSTRARSAPARRARTSRRRAEAETDDARRAGSTSSSSRGRPSREADGSSREGGWATRQPLPASEPVEFLRDDRDRSGALGGQPLHSARLFPASARSRGQPAMMAGALRPASTPRSLTPRERRSRRGGSSSGLPGEKQACLRDELALHWMVCIASRGDISVACYYTIPMIKLDLIWHC